MLKILPIGLVLVSCCGTPNQAKLPLPPELNYPTISAESLACLTDKTYEALNVRRVMCEARIKTLRETIKSTH